ncbi:interleukin-1 receptor-associated kinase 1 [Lampris incognitus]|uniref:interleukin-1 receptor-associated kinase 1 n=1 Tax=Lampris incognitus TaxID=2546036 RepID=UPI0024B50397|nr:interleukin-1 receptor-associated kinase 1 [Lampris incognitus]
MSDFLYQLPAGLLAEFCRIMDGLSDPDWIRFASEVLSDQIDVRLAVRKERRTDWVMNQWENRNGRIGALVDLLERLHFLRARDIILGWRLSSPPPSTLQPPLPPPSEYMLKPSLYPVCPTTHPPSGSGGQRPLPKPGPPPSYLVSGVQQPLQVDKSSGVTIFGGGVMEWAYEEVHAGTQGFSPSLQLGEGGFGHVYRASMKNTTYAVKRLKQDSPSGCRLVEQSFKTEVEKLSQYRHPNIVELLGFSVEGGKNTYCLIYGFMANGSLEDRLHSLATGALSWLQRVSVLEGASRALQFLHHPPERHAPLVHGDVKSSNILLDQFLVPKMGDFGLAQFCRGLSSKTGGKTGSETSYVGRTSVVQGTVAYLPDDYIQTGELGTAVDVFSLGVVLLEILTGRRALEIDKHSKTTYLKDLVLELQGGNGGVSQNQIKSSAAEVCRTHLDPCLQSGPAQDSGPARAGVPVEAGFSGPAGCIEVAALACRALDRRRKKRPHMTEVFQKLQDLLNNLRTSPPQPPTPSLSLDSSLGSSSQQLDKVGPLEDTYCLQNPCCLPSSPCETDESQGFSQYQAFSGHTQNQYRSLSPSIRSQHNYSSDLMGNQFSAASQPTESHYSPPSRNQDSSLTQPSKTSNMDGSGPWDSPNHERPSAVECETDSRTDRSVGNLHPDASSFSPARSLRSSSPGPAGGVQAEPEESDELDFLPG